MPCTDLLSCQSIRPPEHKFREGRRAHFASVLKPYTDLGTMRGLQYWPARASLSLAELSHGTPPR